MKLLKSIAVIMLLAAGGQVVFAGDPGLSSSSGADSSADVPAPPASLRAWSQPSLASWWDGDSAIDDSFGLGPALEHYGLKFFGDVTESYYGQLSGGLPNQPRSDATTELKMKLLFDFSKITDVRGLTFLSYWRYRNAENPALAAGTSGPSSLFNPSKDTTGLGIRIMSQYLEYTTPNKAFTINAGWENPYDQFLQQPLSRLFQNYAIISTKGIGGQAGAGIPVINSDMASTGGTPGVGTPTKGGVRFYTTSPVPWSSSYQAWGATLKIKPTSDTYIESGLYESIAGETQKNPTQLVATSVYPYTSVPASYSGQFKTSNEITPVVGANGQIIPGALQDLGWSPIYINNHGFNFRGAPGFAPSAYVAVKPTTASGGTIYGTYNGAATYQNSAGQYVASPAFFAASPYDQGGLDGNYSHNGLYSVNEIGWTPKFGVDELEGKFAVGGYIWGQPNTNFTPVQYTASVFNPATGKIAYTTYGATKSNPFEENPFVAGIYLQADQQIFSLPGPKDPDGPFTTRGLYTFNEFSFTPPQNNALPFYFQTGLVFNGPFESRSSDAFGIALGAGFYSSYFNAYTQSQNQQLENAIGSAYNATLPNGPVQAGTINPQTGVYTTGKTAASPLTNYYAYLPNYTSTEVVEAFYKFQINKWASFKPDVQYIINPAGNGTVGNDWIVGFSFALTF